MPDSGIPPIPNQIGDRFRASVDLSLLLPFSSSRQQTLGIRQGGQDNEGKGEAGDASDGRSVGGGRLHCRVGQTPNWAARAPFGQLDDALFGRSVGRVSGEVRLEMAKELRDKGGPCCYVFNVHLGARQM